MPTGWFWSPTFLGGSFRHQTDHKVDKTFGGTKLSRAAKAAKALAWSKAKEWPIDLPKHRGEGITRAEAWALDASCDDCEKCR